MSIAWSSSDKDVIERNVNEKSAAIQRDEEAIDDARIKEVFEVSRCAVWIKCHNFHNTTLQFPDHLLQYAPIVAKQIGKESERRVAILGDTSYGECCVDGIAAKHVGADSIIHFGDTCFSFTETLPVLYIFTQCLLDVDDLNYEVKTKVFESETIDNKRVAIFYDVHYYHIFFQPPLRGESDASILKILDGRDTAFLCHPPTYTNANDKNELDLRDVNLGSDLSLHCGRLVPNALIQTIEYNSDAQNVKEDDQCNWIILYIGSSDIYSQYIGLSFPRSQHYNYDPTMKMLLPSNSNVTKAIMRRYFAIEKTKDANRIGILVGTLGVEKYREVIEKCRDTIKSSGKKAYTFLVGKPNAPKLANFPEIDVFVVIACPLNSVALAVGNISQGRDRSGSDFLRPIITPFELEVALNSEQKWIGSNFKACYQTILPGGQDHVGDIKENDGSNSADGGTDISLITGKLRITNGCASNDDNASLLLDEESKSIATQERQLISITHAKGGGQYLSERSWQGLEQKLGDDPPVLAVQGRQGIASNYIGEGQTSHLASNKKEDIQD